MDQTYIALGAMPRLLRDLVESLIDSQPDLRLVQAKARWWPWPWSPEPEIHVFIFAAEPREAELLAGRLLAIRPRLRIIALSKDGRESWLYELHPEALGAVSPERLLSAIRAA